MSSTNVSSTDRRTEDQQLTRTDGRVGRIETGIFMGCELCLRMCGTDNHLRHLLQLLHEMFSWAVNCVCACAVESSLKHLLQLLHTFNFEMELLPEYGAHLLQPSWLRASGICLSPSLQRQHRNMLPCPAFSQSHSLHSTHWDIFLATEVVFICFFASTTHTLL